MTSFSERIDRLEALLDHPAVRADRKVHAEICEQIRRIAEDRDAYRGRIIFRNVEVSR